MMVNKSTNINKIAHLNSLNKQKKTMTFDFKHPGPDFYLKQIIVTSVNHGSKWSDLMHQLKRDKF